MRGSTRFARGRAGAVAVGIGAALALAAPATMAVSQESVPSSIDILSPATLLARGAGVSVPVEVVCEEGAFAFLSVELTQRFGNAPASGFGSSEFRCTGDAQTLDVVVNASGPRVFKKGQALATATLFGVEFPAPTTTETIQISNR